MVPSGRLLILLLVAPILLVTPLRFDLGAGKTKCIGEFMSKHDLAKGGYTVTGVAEGTSSGINVKITGPGDQLEYKQDDAGSGKFAFTASEGGHHKVCFLNTISYQRTIDLQWTAGADTTDYNDVAKKEHLKPLELALRKLEDRIENVHKEMMYQREREERHRDTNESTNSRVAWFSILTIVMILVQTALQITHLYGYFMKKKVISK